MVYIIEQGYKLMIWEKNIISTTVTTEKLLVIKYSYQK